MKFYYIITLISALIIFENIDAQPVVKPNLEQTKSQRFTLILNFTEEYYGRVAISYLVKYGVIIRDTSSIENNKCFFEGELFETTFLYLEFIDLQIPNNEYLRPLIIKKGSNIIHIQNSKQKETCILENINDSLYLKYSNTNENYQNKIYLANKKYLQERNPQILLEVASLEDSLNTFRINTIKSYSEHWIAGYLLNYLRDDLLPEEIKSLYLALHDTVKTSIFGRELENVVLNQVGNRANEFQAITSRNETFKMMRDTSTLTLLFFWATWCKPCKVMMPALKNIHEVYQTKGLKMIGIADNDQEPAGWQNNISTLNLEFMTHILMGRNKKVDIGRLYAVQGIPVIVLVDSNGVIVYRQLSNETEQLQEFIDEFYKII